MPGARLPEFTFELHVCRLAERGWPPGTATERPRVVARQLGTQHRRWDTVVVTATPENLRQRARFGATRLDSDLRFLLRHAPADWTWYRDALPDPGYPWRYVRAAIHRADARGILETDREGNRILIRRRYRYPEWADRIVAIENKPDLDASAADALARQLRYDVALGLADEAWVATRRTGASVEPALLEAMPVEAGIATIDPATLAGDVIWRPRTLRPDEPGERIRTAGDDDEPDEIEPVDPDEKAEIRAGIAERAWERGWRSYAEHMRTDCRHFGLDPGHPAHPPRCCAKERPQTPAECSSSCPSFEPEPPQWRTRGWPIEGGPGKAIKRLLADQRDRRRPTPNGDAGETR